MHKNYKIKAKNLLAQALNIETELIKILSSKEDPGIILNAHKNTPVKQAVKIMDIAYRNNYKIVLATNPK